MCDAHKCSSGHNWVQTDELSPVQSVFRSFIDLIHSCFNVQAPYEVWVIVVGFLPLQGKKRKTHRCANIQNLRGFTWLDLEISSHFKNITQRSLFIDQSQFPPESTRCDATTPHHATLEDKVPMSGAVRRPFIHSEPDAYRNQLFHPKVSPWKVHPIVANVICRHGLKAGDAVSNERDHSYSIISIPNGDNNSFEILYNLI